MIEDPVFIIGAARTGTTWLSNILKDNFGFFTPSHFLHFGVKEPNLFLLDKLYFKLNNRAEFLDVVRFSDIILLTKPTSVSLDGFSFSSYSELLFQLMDMRTVESDCNRWFTKIDPNYFYTRRGFSALFDLIRERYPDAKFIVIKRGFRDYISSYINMPGPRLEVRRSFLASLFACFLAAARYRNLYRFASKQLGENCITIQYESLTSNYVNVLEALGRFLNVTPRSHIDHNMHNTSKSKSFRHLGGIRIRFFEVLASSTVINAWVLRAYSRLFLDRPFKPYHRIKLLHEDPVSLRNVLQEEGHFKLMQEIEKLNG